MKSLSIISKLLIIIFVSTIISGCNLPFLNTGHAAIKITSSPSASVYINGNHVGQTPYDNEKIKPGDYTVRLVIEDEQSKDWQTKVTLSSRVTSVVNHNFGVSDDTSSSYILHLEPITNQSIAELSLITIPDSSIVKINDKPEGISPITISPISIGSQAVSLIAPGYQEQRLSVETRVGFRLIISSQLAKTPALSVPEIDVTEATDSAYLSSEGESNRDAMLSQNNLTPTVTQPSSATVSASTIQPPYVIITETGTGWLRVRSEPTINSDEVGRIDVGSKYAYLETNDTGWHKIIYNSNNEGWIAGTYATLVRD